MRNTNAHWTGRSILALIATLSALTSGVAQTLTWLGTLGGSLSSACSVSNNGVVVGFTYDHSEECIAFLWTSNDGLRGLGFGSAYDISADGAVIVGGSGMSSWVLWTLDGERPMGFGSAFGVSANGNIVVGTGLYSQAFRWMQGDMRNLGYLPGGNYSLARGVSADGSVVVGFAVTRDILRRAFIWTPDTGMQQLSLQSHYESEAYDVSADGLVVVGYWLNYNQPKQAFRWTQDDGIQLIGGGVAYGVSADGSIVVGAGNDGFGAFRWTASGGMQNLNTVYAALLNESWLDVARAISPNGRYIVGFGYNALTRRTEAFLLDTQCEDLAGDVNGDRVVDDADLLIVLFNFGGNDANADLNRDGVVDDADLLIVLFNFGAQCID